MAESDAESGRGPLPASRKRQPSAGAAWGLREHPGLLFNAHTPRSLTPATLPGFIRPTAPAALAWPHPWAFA